MLKPLTLIASFDKFPGLPPRSSERLKYERFMHSFHYPYIVHPYSRFRYYWDCLMCFSVFLHVIIATLNSDCFYHGDLVYHVLILGFQIHGFMDIVLNFLTGYTEKTNKVVVLLPSKITVNYLKTWFLIDVISILPYESLSYYIPNCYGNWYNKVYSCHFYADVFSVTFLLRIFCFRRYFNRIVMLKMINVFWAQGILYSFCLASIFLAFANVNTFLPFYHPNSNSTWIGISWRFCLDHKDHDLCHIYSNYRDNRLSLFLASVLSFLEENLIYFKNYETFEVIIRIFFYYFSVFGFTALVAYIINLAIGNKSTTERFYEKDGKVRSYLKRKPFTEALHKKVLLYFQESFEKKDYEDELLEFLPISEMEKITISTALPVIQKVSLFMHFPKELLREVACIVQNEIYLPHDVLVRAGEIGRSMFIIKFGTVAIYSKKFVKLTEFDDGDYFGVKSIIFPMKILNASAVAVKISSVCRLDRDDFLALMQSYPGYLDHLQRHLIAEKEMRT